MKRLCISIETDDDTVAEDALRAAIFAAGQNVTVYRSWVHGTRIGIYGIPVSDDMPLRDAIVLE